MNFAVIFAGGVGRRMSGSQIPKQFLEAEGKPILVHTLEYFQNSASIDKIVISCVRDWIDYTKQLVDKYALTKVVSIVPGGETGQLSIYNGLAEAAKFSTCEDDIVLIHDGVRPLISLDLIDENVRTVKEYGSCITCVKVIETIVESQDQHSIKTVYERDPMLVAKAPQSFRLCDILAAQEKALAEGMTTAIDCCTLMASQGFPLHMIMGDYKNIKITTPIDYAMFKAILAAEKEENCESDH